MPSFKKGSRDGSVTITHREYITDVLSSVSNFSLFVAEWINPGNVTLFPWLSGLANSYEEYDFRKLKFVYEPITATSSSGAVHMAFDYDAQDANPSTKQQMMNFAGATSGPVWASCSCVFDRQQAKALTPRRFVTPAAAPTGTDPKTYFVSAFYLMIANCSTGTNAYGELYVEYEVDLFTPQTVTAISDYVSNGSNPSMTNTNLFPANIVGSLGVVSAQTNTITFERLGRYLLDVVTTGTGVASSLGVGAVNGLTQSNIYSWANSGATSAEMLLNVLVTSVPATLALTTAAYTTYGSCIARAAAYRGDL